MRSKRQEGTHFDCPEVTGEKEDDCHHAGDETPAEELAKQIGEDGGDSEEEVEERGQRVPAESLMKLILAAEAHQIIISLHKQLMQ